MGLNWIWPRCIKPATTEKHIAIDSSENPILIKPAVKYENYEFEQIFGFRSHCSNWDPHKIVSIRKRNGSDVSINTISYEEVRYVKKDKENGELRTV